MGSKGRSFWEMSCEAQVTSKANSDYNKRTEGHQRKGFGKASLLIVVTAKKVARKGKWLATNWRFENGIIRAYDADDLEQWLEQTPAVKLQIR